MPKVQREETRVEGRGTEVSSETDERETSKKCIVTAAWKVRVDSYRRRNSKGRNRLTVPRAHD